MLTEENQKKLKEIRDSGTFCCITIKSDYNFMWDIYLTMSEMTGKNNSHAITHHISHEDLNQAVIELYNEVIDYLDQ